ncbi:MAG: putative membrane protein, partial [Candidatus Azotimanducaceae bacterium]
MMKEQIRIVLVGLLMGAAEVVPGVSGGTIAFVSGLYERLINSIQRLTPMRLLDLPRLGLVQWWLSLDLNFLALLFGSMFVSILVLARGVIFLLEFYPVMIWSFFFGLIIASVFVMGRKLLPFTSSTFWSLLLGLVLGVVITRIAPLESEVTPLILFFGGCIAVCAWILPGLSGSFILLILGLYQVVMNAVKDFDLLTMGYVAAGCVVGLLSFSRLLSVLLYRYHDLTVSLLVGFMLGSLTKIWPWRHTTSYQMKPEGGQIPLVEEAVLPTQYEA